MDNVSKISRALVAGGFTSIQKVQSLFLGVARTKVLGDFHHEGTLYTLQMHAGLMDEFTAVWPALLVGAGDFPKVEKVHDPKDGCAITGAMNPRVVVDAALARIRGRFRGGLEVSSDHRVAQQQCGDA